MNGSSATSAAVGTDGLRARVCTPAAPGGIALVEVDGPDAAARLAPGIGGPIDRTPRLRGLPGGDRGLAVAPARDRVWLLPHGGPAIVARLVAALGEAGVDTRPGAPSLPPRPTAIEALPAAIADAIAAARSPRAIDLLLAQPARWARHGAPGPRDRSRSARLDRLVVPPVVVLAGPPGTGKSTLTNALAGREVAVTAAGAGTTRDPVATVIELDGVVVRWIDTAGHGDGRRAGGPLDAAAERRAREAIVEADLVVSAADAASGRLELPAGVPDLRIATRADLGPRGDAERSVAATAAGGRSGLADLATAIRRRLVGDDDLASDRPWAFPGCPTTSGKIAREAEDFPA